MGCAMHKGPQPSEGPPSIRGAPTIWGALSNLKGLDNLRGPQQSEWPRQSEGPHQSERPTANWGAPAIRKAPAIWGALSNLKSPWQSEGPYQLERPPAIWGATAIWGVSAIWGTLSNWGSDPWELLSFRSSFRPMLSIWLEKCRRNLAAAMDYIASSSIMLSRISAMWLLGDTRVQQKMHMCAVWTRVHSHVFMWQWMPSWQSLIELDYI